MTDRAPTTAAEPASSIGKNTNANNAMPPAPRA